MHINYQFKKMLPYTIPILSTLVFAMLVLNGFFIASMFVFFLITLFHKSLGKFPLEELKQEYHFFHGTTLMKRFLIFNGIFFVAFQLFILFYLLTNELKFWYELLPLIYGAIMINSNFSISLAHELMHSDNKLGRLLGNILLISNGFFYLRADHLYIHHRYIGTENDPASAYENQSFYPYLIQSIKKRWRIVMGLKSRFPYKLKPATILHSRINFIMCICILILSGIWNFQIFLWLILQFLLVTLIYEVITYIQHYGLRRTDKNIEMDHAWNCYYRLSAYMYFFMPIHSVHHTQKESQILSLNDLGPSFPRPFYKMFMLALNPKLWFKTVNPLIPKNTV